MAPSATASFLNGERAVVVLVVARILFSLPTSLLFHGVSFSLLSLSSLFLEIRVENSPDLLSRFNTRPGASSGILLGAMTLPAVMLSKLIQLTRAYSIQEVELEELEHMIMEYWATSASCCAVLVFLWVVLSRSANIHSSSSSSAWSTMFSLSCMLLHAALCCVSLAVMSHTGFNTVLKLLWILFHGFAACGLIQHFLCTFPSCASIGEALLVTAGLVLYFGDVLACTIAKMFRRWIVTDLFSVHYGLKRTEISIIIQGMVLGLLLYPMVFKCVLNMCGYISKKEHSELRRENEIAKSLIFFISLGVMMIMIIPCWMQFVQNFHLHPVLWVFAFVFSEPYKRLSLCIYWVCLICASVSRFYNISRNSKIERILLRKYYHLMAVLMFLPALIFQPEFLDLAFGAAFAAFLALEIIRGQGILFLWSSVYTLANCLYFQIWRIWPIGQPLHKFMNAFTDHRDSDLLIVSHFSLLLGCALPIWMSSGFNDRPLALFAGILSLGIGDTMASMVGYKYGVLRWSKAGKKTVEGTAAGITSVLAVCTVLLPVLASSGYIFNLDWVSLFFAVTASGMLEAYTAQLDNAFIPLIFYSLLCL